MQNSCHFSRNLHAKLFTNARNKARYLRVTSLAGCRLTYQQFAGEFTRSSIACSCGYFCLPLKFFALNCQYFCFQLRVFLPEIESILRTVAGIFVCNCEYFYLLMRVFLLSISGIRACAFACICR